MSAAAWRNRPGVVNDMIRDAGYWIRGLQLVPHPEGGHYRETYRASETVTRAALPSRFPGDRCFATSIYYLLQGGEVSTFHRIRSDELWYHHDGAAIVIHVIDPEGRYRALRLGRDMGAGEAPQAVVSAGAGSARPSKAVSLWRGAPSRRVSTSPTSSSPGVMRSWKSSRSAVISS